MEDQILKLFKLQLKIEAGMEAFNEAKKELEDFRHSDLIAMAEMNKVELNLLTSKDIVSTLAKKIGSELMEMA